MIQKVNNSHGFIEILDFSGCVTWHSVFHSSTKLCFTLLWIAAIFWIKLNSAELFRQVFIVVFILKFIWTKLYSYHLSPSTAYVLRGYGNIFWKSFFFGSPTAYMESAKPLPQSQSNVQYHRPQGSCQCWSRKLFFYTCWRPETPKRKANHTGFSFINYLVFCLP